MATETRIDEASRRVRQQTESAQGGLAFEARGDVVGKRDDFIGGTEHELTRVKHERLVGSHFDLTRQVRLICSRVDVRVLVVVEDTEELVETDVDARGLDHVARQRIENDPARVQFGQDVAIREKHGKNLAEDVAPGAYAGTNPAAAPVGTVVGFAQYGPVISNPEARSALLLGTVVRTPIFASWVVITLHVVSTLHRGYAAAGFAAAVVAAAVAIGSPWRGRAIDRIGVRGSIVPSLVVMAACWAVAPWVGYGSLLALASIAGLFMIPVFSIVRMSLVAAVPEDQRRTALSLDSVLTEVSFMVGPLAGAWAATVWDTRWVLLTVEAFIVAGGVLMWVVNPRVAPDAPDGGTTISRRRWMTAQVLAVLAASTAAVAVLQGTDLGIVAMLRHLAANALIGPALAVWGLGSLVGGLIYGAMRTVVPLWLLLGGLAAITAPAALANDEWTLIGLVFVAGALCAPTMTAVVEQLSRIVPAAALGEAMGWHASSLTLGEALGAPFAGAAIDRWGAGAGFWSVALVGLLAAVLIWLVEAARTAARAREGVGYSDVTPPS